jgi:hypothetical protein
MKITRKVPLIFGLLMVASTSNIASTWNVLVNAGNNESLYFFDADSVDKVREITTIWIKTVRTTSPYNDGSWATALRWRFNCTKKTVQTLSMSNYDIDGKFLKSYPEPSKEESVIPDSNGDIALKVSCQPDFPRNKSGRDYAVIADNDVFRATREYVEYMKSRKDMAPK